MRSAQCTKANASARASSFGCSPRQVQARADRDSLALTLGEVREVPESCESRGVLVSEHPL